MKKTLLTAAAAFSLALTAQVPDLPLLKIFHFAGSRRPAENVLLSPWGIQECFGMVSGGAGKQSAGELSKILGLNKAVSGDISQARKSLQQSSKNFKSYNVIFLERQLKAKKSFIHHATKVYNSDIYSVDFDQKSKCARVLNNIVKRQTSGMFGDIFTERSFLPKPDVLLLNTLYFESAWKESFVEDHTKREKFTIPSPDGKAASRKKTVDMMNDTRYLPYYEDKELHGIILTFRNRRFKLLVLKPKNSAVPLSRAAAVLAEKGIQHFQYSSSELYKTNIKLPKMKLSGETDLKELFCSAGMKSLFSSTGGGLTEMVTNRPLFISSAKQLVKLDLNEKSTKVAAVTYTAGVTSAPPVIEEKENYFYANHPFILVLFDDKTNAVLLTASIVNP